MTHWHWLMSICVTVSQKLYGFQRPSPDGPAGIRGPEASSGTRFVAENPHFVPMG